MKTSLLLLPLALLLPIAQPAEKPSKDGAAVEVKVVKYEAFAEAIKAQHGKIVLVYCWASYDPVSVKELPRLLKMREKYAAKDVTIITVNLDPLEERAERVQKILVRVKASLPNFILDEEFGTWSKKLKIVAEPAFVVFDRNGNLVASLDLTRVDGETPDTPLGNAEMIVGKLLAENAK